VTAKLTSIEQHAQAAQRSHDARFADLHKVTPNPIPNPTPN